MRVAILGSGGKDSAYATWWALMRGWDVRAVVTMCVTGDDSMMFQTQGVGMAGMQAASAGIPWLPILTSGEMDEEMEDLENGLRGLSNPDSAMEISWPEGWDSSYIAIHTGALSVDGIVSGALRSDFQKTRIELMCQRLGIHSFSPLWHNSPNSHMSSLCEHGFEVVIASVSSEGLGMEWLGKKLGMSNLRELEELSKRYRFNVDGEGGEFETLVLGAPHMNRDIEITMEPVWNGSRGHLKVKSAVLAPVR
ncbi:MAG: diphthine--ammonia ligase [Candidatus Thalassarchaeaceae archaeon]|nr:TIGR00289 family protein [Euryarchaeota archaeon]MDP6870987.1 diphthine--ammonia ligase [Candidatus Thalassarchaeaceae archaeon]